MMIPEDRAPYKDNDEDAKVLKRVELKSISLKDLLAKYPEKRKRPWGRPL